MPITSEFPLYSLEGDIDGIATCMPDSDIANLAKSRMDGVAWACGDFLEIITTSSAYLSGIEPPKGDEKAKKKETLEEMNKRIAIRAQKQVRRIVNTNRFNIMWTLTMCPKTSKYAGNYKKPVPVKDQTDYDKMRKLWKAFIRRLRKAYPGIKWLVVFEFHDSSKTSALKRGTYHFHLAVKQYIPFNIMLNIWQHGNVREDYFNEEKEERGGKVRNPGAYMSKYVGKAFNRKAIYRKRYTRSRNSLTPKKYSIAGIPDEYLSANKSVVFERKREFDFWDEKVGIGGIYGVIQRTYKIEQPGI